MNRIFLIAGLMCLVADVAEAQDILRGKIAKLDAEAKSVTVTIDGKDRQYGLDDQTRFFDSNAATLAARFKILEVGKPIMLKPTTRDGREVLEGIKLADAPPP